VADGIGRRVFLGSGLAAGVAGTIGPFSLAASRPRKPASLAPPDFELEEATIADLRRKMESGEHTARSLTEAYLARIEGLDGDGPALRALLETNPDALEVAGELDAERRAGHVRGALHGIPVLLKDNLETADRMETTAGSLALLGARPGRDAFAAGRLREAGAVILGKANLSEWANFRSTASSSGWSARGGQAKNPYALDRTPCGSSSGSGTAVAANLCAVAVGRFEGFWELKLNPWDKAAGILLVTEAGGKVTDLAGNPCSLFEDEICASNGLIHEAMLPVFAEIMTERK